MDITLPRLGEGAESGTVVTVLVKVGDAVKANQTLLEMESEKAVAPIPTSHAGTVSAVHVKAGDKISVGQKLISLEAAAGAAAPEAPAARPAPPRPATTPMTPAPAPAGEDYVYHSPSGAAPPAPPSVRKVAAELGLDLTRIRGSEAGGRITMGDLRAYVQRLQQLAVRGSTAPAAPARPTPVSVDFSKWGPVTKQPLTSLRSAIGKKMTQSWTTVPHVTQFDDADLTAVTALKEKYAATYEKLGARLTPTPFVLAALVSTLKKHPMFNASLDEAAGQIVLKQYYHLGIAVDTEGGLIVPVLRDADKKSLAELSKHVQELAERTRARKISAEELQGGTFTVSNQGGIGGAHFTPVINVPEVAILGIGKAVVKPVVRGGKIEPRPMLPLGLSYDHRVIDGGNAARFIRDLVEAIEQFPEARVKG